MFRNLNDACEDEKIRNTTVIFTLFETQTIIEIVVNRMVRNYILFYLTLEIHIGNFTDYFSVGSNEIVNSLIF